MKNSFKKSIMFMMLLLALTFSALGVTPVLADDGVTPPADAPVVQEPVADTPVVEQPAADAPAADPVVADAPLVEQPAVTEEPAVTPEEETATVAEVLEQLPADTALIVLDESGVTLPLATQDAATAMVSGDPMWCPRNSKPGSGDCTPGQASFNDLIDLLATDAGATYGGAGTIYISWDYASDNSAATYTDYGQDVVFGHGTLTDLVVQGGWDFVNNRATGDRSDLSGINSLNFIDWGGYGDPGTSLTINDIVIDNSGWTGSTFNGSGLYVGSYYDVANGVVALNNVSVTNGAGAYIATGNGGDVIIDGRYSDDSSDFSGNTGDGLYVSSDGGFDAYNLIANGNLGSGASVGAHGDANITNGAFNNNTKKYGLYVTSNGGNLTLDQVTANGNNIGTRAAASGQITITNGTFNNNGKDGLYAITTMGSDIILDGLIASGNKSTGATLSDRPFYCGDDANGLPIHCGSGNIFITDSAFDQNVAGLTAITYGGDINLSGVSFSDNTKHGANLSAPQYACGYDADGNEISCSGGDIFITKSIFNDNTGNGAWLMTSGDVSVKCSEFNGNGNYGIDAGGVDGSLDLDGITFDGNLTDAYNYTGTANVNNGDCNPVVPSSSEGNGGNGPIQYASLYTVIEQTQGQLPAALGSEKFVSALKVVLTDEGRDVTDLAITLSFPIPADMKDASLAVMFWNGSAWVEVSGGSVVNGFFVITVNQPGDYVLVAK